MVPLLLSVLLAAPPEPRQDEWVERRFERVHLRNGNFLDGRMVRNTEREVTLVVPAGRITIRREQIARVEEIRIRTLAEKPPEVKAPPAPLPPDVPVPGRAPPALALEAPEPPAAVRVDPTVAPYPAGQSVRDRVDRALAQARAATPDRKHEVLSPLGEEGEETHLYLTSLLETLDPVTMAAAAQTLMGARSQRSLAILSKILGGAHRDARIHAASIVAAIGDVSVARAVRPLLRDGDAAVRRAAVSALQALGDGESIEAMAPLCADPDSDTRRTAMEACLALAPAQGGLERLEGPFRDVLDRAGTEAKADLLVCIGRGGLKGMWSMVVAHLNDRATEARAAAAMALGMLAMPDSADDLMRALGAERERDVRVQIALATGRMRLRRAVEPLVGWLAEDDEAVRLGAEAALREITGQNFGPDSAKWAAWWREARSKE